jgi:hypothetical protein
VEIKTNKRKWCSECNAAGYFDSNNEPIDPEERAAFSCMWME